MNQIATAKGMKPAKLIPIDGMKRSPLAIVELPNNGDTLSYGVTHKPTGYALIPARTDDLKLAIRCARRIWKGLDAACREALGREDFATYNRKLFDQVGCVVTMTKSYLDEQIANRIRVEVQAELKAQQ